MVGESVGQRRLGNRELWGLYDEVLLWPVLAPQAPQAPQGPCRLPRGFLFWVGHDHLKDNKVSKQKKEHTRLSKSAPTTATRLPSLVTTGHKCPQSRDG